MKKSIEISGSAKKVYLDFQLVVYLIPKEIIEALYNPNTVMSNLSELSKNDNRKKLNSIISSETGNIANACLDGLIPLLPVGSIVKSFIQSGIAIRDYFFLRKLNTFLFSINTDDISDEEIDGFFKSLENNKEKVEEYLLGLLISVESEDKALLMGYIYKAAVKGRINHIQMLRLCSIINRSFVFDLKALHEFEEESENESIEAMNLINLGLIDNYIGGYWKNVPTVQLNEIGLILLDILKSEEWFN